MKTYKDHRIAEKLILISLFLLVNITMYSSCGSSSRQSVAHEEIKTGKIKTESIVFQCDKQINQGMLLPVDIIYVTKYRRPREVISIGPNNWFNSLEREKWGTRQTLSLKGGEIKTLKLNSLWLKNTKLLVIFANFKDVKDPNSQEIIIDQSGKQSVTILVMPQNLAVKQKIRSCL
jgi:hypothetical protein